MRIFWWNPFFPPTKWCLPAWWLDTSCNNSVNRWSSSSIVAKDLVAQVIHFQGVLAARHLGREGQYVVPKKWDCLSEKEKCWQNMSKKNDKVMNLLYQARFDTRHLVSGSRAFFSLGKCENPWNFCINPWRSSVWSRFQSIFLKEKCSIKPSKSKTEVVKVYVISKQKKPKTCRQQLQEQQSWCLFGSKILSK